MTILLTGFELFGKVKDNPSQRIVESIAKQKHDDIVTHIFPVDYVKAGEQLKRLIEKHQPQAIILLGVAQSRDAISLERIAVNVNDASIPDNEGNLKSGQQIVEGAPVGYWSTLPIEAMYKAVKKVEIPVKMTNHAGAYLCNHVFYVARHTLETSGNSHIPCGFIHVPDMGEEAPKMALKQQIRAIELCLEVVRDEIRVKQVPS